MGNSADNRRRIDRNGREEHNKRQREYMREYRKNNPKKYLVSAAKERSKRYNRPFDLTEDDIEIPELCPVLGIELVRNTQGLQDNSPSIDRIDNDLGYVRGNVVVVSMKANRLKSDATPDELMRVAEFYKTNGKWKA